MRRYGFLAFYFKSCMNAGRDRGPSVPSDSVLPTDTYSNTYGVTMRSNALVKKP